VLAVGNRSPDRPACERDSAGEGTIEIYAHVSVRACVQNTRELAVVFEDVWACMKSWFVSSTIIFLPVIA
jgi:hypothetical protein